MDLIDKEALISQIELNICKPCKDAGHDYNGVRCRACQYEDEIDDIDDAPTVDAVPVVRCKDCKHADAAYCHDHKTISKTDVYCLLLEKRCKNSFYCADGERKTDEKES